MSEECNHKLIAVPFGRMCVKCNMFISGETDGVIFDEHGTKQLEDQLSHYLDELESASEG